jgi:hypothetical protein
MSAFRVSPPRVFPEATHAAKPPMGAAGSADAFRQAQFVLGKDLDLVLRGLELEGKVASDSAGAKFRTQQMAAALGHWSRAWLCRLEALHAVEWGNYAAAVTLVRAAADFEAAEIALLRTGAAEWEEWLEEGGVRLAPEAHATEYRLHAFRSAEVLAGHEVLGPLYRAALDLSMPHFGATLLLTGNDSGPERVLMTFGDRDFHLGLAELALGWLELLSVAQVEALLGEGGPFNVTDPAALVAFAREARAAAAAKERCRIEEAEVGGEKRYVVANWRRAPGAAAKRVLL